MNYPHIAQMIFNTPLMIAPQKAAIIVEAIGGRFGVSGFYGDLESYPIDFEAKVGTTIPEGVKEKGWATEYGAAIIPVTGTLVQKSGSLRPASGMTGYDTISTAFNQALADPLVKAICLDVDSPGGVVSGCFACADEIYKARGNKPIMAILTDVACSAAYMIASAADVITIPESGNAGSIGVIAMHVDLSKKMAAEGAKVTLVTYGARKSDGNPSEPLSDSALARMQRDVNAMGEMFTRRVARNRGMTIKAVREQEAGIFLGKSAVEAGLCDEVLCPADAFAALVKSVS